MFKTIAAFLTAVVMSGIAFAEDAQTGEDSSSNRQQTLEGSKSRWSGQFNLTYSGSSLDHPFSEEAPNPGHDVPPPLVTLSGTFSARYRIDSKTTAGLGTGIMTETPFQGPKNTSAADPYVDIARSFQIGALHNYVDFQYGLWTSHEYYSEYGYRQSFSFLFDSSYAFSFGLTTGLSLLFDKNLFATGEDWDESQQTSYDYVVNPYLEYAVNEIVNLRASAGAMGLHDKDLPGTFTYHHPDIYQTIGVGVAITKSVFFYVYLKARPYSGHDVTNENTVAGFNTIINLL